MTGPCESLPAGNGLGDASAGGVKTIAPPGWADAEAAAARLRRVFPPSPLLRAGPELAEELLLKADTLLPTGSFKVRGIWDAVSQLSEERVAPGLSTVSAGNTALALAWAARRREVPAFSLLPETAPPAKVEGFRAAGGTPRLVDGSRTVPVPQGTPLGGRALPVRPSLDLSAGPPRPREPRRRAARGGAGRRIGLHPGGRRRSADRGGRRAQGPAPGHPHLRGGAGRMRRRSITA